jgi:hypothetical protein
MTNINHPGRRIRCFHSRSACLPTRYSQDQVPITRLQSSLPGQSHQCSQQTSPLSRPLPRRRQCNHSHPSLLYQSPTFVPSTNPLLILSSRSLLHHLRRCQVDLYKVQPYSFRLLLTSPPPTNHPLRRILNRRTRLLCHPHPRRSNQAKCPNGRYSQRRQSKRHTPNPRQIQIKPLSFMERLHRTSRSQLAFHRFTIPSV